MSVRKDTEKVISFGSGRAHLRRAIISYVRKFREEIKKPGNYLGGWRDGDKFYLDISKVVRDRKEAFSEAKKSQQLAIFDLKSKKTLKVAA